MYLSSLTKKNAFVSIFSVQINKEVNSLNRSQYLKRLIFTVARRGYPVHPKRKKKPPYQPFHDARRNLESLMYKADLHFCWSLLLVAVMQFIL